MQKLTVILVTMVALVTGACGGDEVDGTVATLAADGGVVGSDAAQCSDLSYETFGQAFLESYCVSCHGAALAEHHVVLDTLSGFTTSKAIAASQVSSGSMPPRGTTSPSSSERTMFVQWVRCGGT